MAQPRVFAHSAVPVDTTGLGVEINEKIQGTEERGCALYIGTGGTLVVEMEGTHKLTDPVSGEEFDTNISIFKNVNSGVFLPILVTRVLDSSSEIWEGRLAYYKLVIQNAFENIKELDDIMKDKEEELTELNSLIEKLKQQEDEAREQGQDVIADSLALQVEQAEAQLAQVQKEIQAINEQIDEYNKTVAEYEEYAESLDEQIEKLTVEGDVDDILGLF